MHAIYSSLFALAALAGAQDASGMADAIKMIPACAIGCLTAGVGNSTCAPTDAYCQCTSGAADIAKVVTPCLCETIASGTCKVEDLMQANQASMKICTAALKAKGETFKQSPPVDPSMCKASMGGRPPIAGGYGGNTTIGGNRTNTTTTTTTNTTIKTTTSASPSGTTSPIPSSGAASAVGTLESFQLLITCGLLGFAGVALMAL